MTNFRKPYGGGGSRTGGARPKFNRNASARTGRPGARSGSSYRGDMEKFDAICSNCGKSCQVPFRPDGKKPVYCKDCFDAPRTMHPTFKRNPRVSAERVASPTPSGEGKTIGDLTRQIAAMNAKIDTMLKILEGGE